MNIVMGPVLGFQGISDSHWQLSALFVAEGDGVPDSLTIQDDGDLQEVENPTPLKSLAARAVTSSGIVHPAPPALMSFALEFLSRNPEHVDRGIRTSLLEFLGTRRRFIMARNWLGLEPDGEDGRIWVNWYVEGEDDPYTKAIHPVRG